MSGKVTVTVQVARGARGRKRLRPTEDVQLVQTPERVPRVARMLALAHHWRGLIRAGVVADRADVARLVGVSRARISQIMRLLDLAPDIQKVVLEGQVDGPGAERRLRGIAEDPIWAGQAAGWGRLVASVNAAH